ncbi:uncharacterized protein K489DRAFT_33104 [Dissoconium aciculare CBS 342.82]|uniref:Uncharacterized protein n=1 Tax=Dissoconium aciculare CBS 342.82 TaxID=1314786 RepID=A0A6J3LXH8_9PEZI|nr:uncharacterized protein K489DRAFT_33104 [Dissoconium aciculare CBS 342.82]KAF1820456.1 hypothetical protein K489DRAFT_33104 [Dissoconium aciculare CBS 342.82]
MTFEMMDRKERVCGSSMRWQKRLLGLIGARKFWYCNMAVVRLRTKHVTEGLGMRAVLLTAQCFWSLSSTFLWIDGSCGQAHMHRFFADPRRIPCKFPTCIDCASNGSCRGHRNPSQAHAASRLSDNRRAESLLRWLIPRRQTHTQNLARDHCQGKPVVSHGYLFGSYLPL